MRFSALICAMIVALMPVTPVSAQTPLQRLVSADEARKWEAVGRVNLGLNVFCTGVLVSADLVLTAAHCLFEKGSGKLVEIKDIQFLAGWRDGRAAAHRKARRVIVHHDYSFGGANRMDRIASDIALIELDRPIRASTMAPFERHTRPAVGEEVMVVSYALNRSESPSLQENCHVLSKDPRTMILSCGVTFGASGSPIFVMHDGKPKIASVISSKAHWNNQDVSLGAALGDPFEALLHQMDFSDGVFQGKRPGKLSLAEQLGRVKKNMKILRK